MKEQNQNLTDEEIRYMAITIAIINSYQMTRKKKVVDFKYILFNKAGLLTVKKTSEGMLIEFKGSAIDFQNDVIVYRKHNCESKSFRKSSLNNRWKNMRSRCNNPNCPQYPNYGGRGIKICSAWQNNRMNFVLDVLLFLDYADHLILDRIDVDGNYTLENCRFTTTIESAANKRNTLYLTVNGTKRALSL